MSPVFKCFNTLSILFFLQDTDGAMQARAVARDFTRMMNSSRASAEVLPEEVSEPISNVYKMLRLSHVYQVFIECL